MLPLSPEPMRSSTGNSIESVEQPWRGVEPLRIVVMTQRVARVIVAPAPVMVEPSRSLCSSERTFTEARQ